MDALRLPASDEFITSQTECESGVDAVRVESVRVVSTLQERMELRFYLRCARLQSG